MVRRLLASIALLGALAAPARAADEWWRGNQFANGNILFGLRTPLIGTEPLVLGSHAGLSVLANATSSTGNATDLGCAPVSGQTSFLGSNGTSLACQLIPSTSITGLAYQLVLNQGGSPLPVQPKLNFGTGLTAANNGSASRTDVTNNLSTGVVGGQTAFGGTGAGEALTLQGTTSAAPGPVKVVVGTSAGQGLRILRASDGLEAGEFTTYLGGSAGPLGLKLDSILSTPMLSTDELVNNDGQLTITSSLDGPTGSYGITVNSAFGNGDATGVQFAIVPGPTQLSNPFAVFTTGLAPALWTTPAGAANFLGPMTVSSLVGPGFVKASSGGLFSVDTTTYTPSTRTVQGTSPILIAGGTSAVDLSANRVWSLATNGVTYGLLQQGTALSVLGRSANSTGNLADIATTSGSNALLRESGGTIGWGGVVAPLFFSGGNLILDYDASSLILSGGTVLERAALIGAVTAGAGSNTTAFGAAPALSVLANATPSSAVPAYLACSGAGQVIQDTGTALACAALAYSSLTGTPTSLPPSGAAGGALTGTYPNPGVNLGAGASVTGALPLGNIAQGGAVSTNVLAWNGTAWAPAAVGSGGITQLTGGVTAGPGSGSQVATVHDIAAGALQDGKLIATNIVAPATPSTGTTALYVDSTAKNFFALNDAGTKTHGMQTVTLGAHNFVTATTDAGGLTGAQPVEADVTNLVIDLAGKQGTITWPTVGQILSSSGTASVPVGDANLTYVSATPELLVPAGGLTTPGVGFTGFPTDGFSTILSGARISTIIGGVRALDVTSGTMFLIPVGGVAQIDLTNGGGGGLFANSLSLTLKSAGNSVNFATAQLATTFTTGYMTLPSTAGVPTGTPANIVSGQIPLVVDSTDDRLYLRSSSWKPYGQFTGGLASGPLCNTTTTGLWSACTAANLAAAQTWPGAGQVLVSSGTSTAPIGNSTTSFNLSSTHASIKTANAGGGDDELDLTDSNNVTVGTSLSTLPYMKAAQGVGVGGTRGQVVFNTQNAVTSSATEQLDSVYFNGVAVISGSTSVAPTNGFNFITIDEGTLTTTIGNTVAVTSPTSLAIIGAPSTAGGTGTVTMATPYAFYVHNDTSRFDGHIVQSTQSVSSATNITPATNGNVTKITGTTAISTIDSTNFTEGSIIWLYLTNTITLNNATSGTFTELHLAGGVNASMAAQSRIGFMLVAGQWYEIARSN